MAHSFSVTALKTLEQIFDLNIANLRTRHNECCESAVTFDLKQHITRYQYDLTGDLAFNHNFGA
jgi:hypothetical protein